jgi:uncharacterized protein (TIGR03435 family)
VDDSALTEELAMPSDSRAMRGGLHLRQPIVIAAIAVVSISANRAALTQAVTSSSPIQFDAVSIKPHVNSSDNGFRVTPGRYTARGIALGRLIGYAYSEEGFRIIGPRSLLDERYDIDATARREFTHAELYKMIAFVLEQRFSLRVHRESREMPVYALVVARSDGALGPNLKRVEGDCLQREPGKPPPCPIRSTRGSLSVSGNDWNQFGLARFLSGEVERVVLDRTGLQGHFDFVLQWQKDPQATAAGATTNLPSIFVALEEQLGLKLERRMEPVDVLVVDQLTRPTPN